VTALPGRGGVLDVQRTENLDLQFENLHNHRDPK
jgi:hypothetical protein